MNANNALSYTAPLRKTDELSSVSPSPAEARSLRKIASVKTLDLEKRVGSLIKTAQGQLMRSGSRRECFSWSRPNSSNRLADDNSSSATAARILRSSRREMRAGEAVVSLDESLEKNREYWWIPAENCDQSAVKFAMQKMNVVVLSEEGVFAHF